MVHALKKTRRLLIKGGLLIEVHDEPVSPTLALQFRDKIFDVGRLQDNSGFERVQQAAEAVEQVNKDELFERVESQLMEYKIYIDSLDSFNDWLSRQWDTTYIETKSETYIRESLGIDGFAQRVIVSRRAHVSILKAL
ncbi:MAG: hypothetical protein BMS9Abin02_1818 [Anaerolineae bacterium]|nr:MAG: hypothetical protein BMS9Abin02_1818 [Anaerolineae bacterium]